jgi:hypothetical protein
VSRGRGASDLRPVTGSVIGGEGLDEPLAELLAEVQRHTLDAIGWYLHHRRTKSRWSRALRGTAIAFAAAAGLVPLWGTVSAAPAAEFGYLLFGVSASCVAFDRFFGLSTAWMRYMTANVELQRHLARFRYAWVALDLSLPAPELRRQRLDLLRRLHDAVSATIDRETAEWVAEFNGGLAQWDTTARRPAPGLPPEVPGPSAVAPADPPQRACPEGGRGSWPSARPALPVRRPGGSAAGARFALPSIFVVRQERS